MSSAKQIIRHPKELCSLGVLLRIVSGEGWGRRRFQEEEGAGEEMGTETPPSPLLPAGRWREAPTGAHVRVRVHGQGEASPRGAAR